MLDEAIARIKQMEMYFDILKKSREGELKNPPNIGGFFILTLNYGLRIKTLRISATKVRASSIIKVVL